MSFFLVDAAPGRGPLLHRHDYVEVFTVLEGQAAGEAHGFTATGEGSRQLNIHSSPRFVTEWLEQEAYG